ncbi:MAG TPA: ribbon-helix-helix protein, CopG family [Gaiellaceae bacterium]|nr:ribbon-helix-helix protein, CopG family [Gaiellaceae bacterium]
MEKTTIYLPGELQRRLQAAARRAGRPQAELVRKALTEFLDRDVRPRPRSVGIVEDGRLPAREADAWLEANWDPR